MNQNQSAGRDRALYEKMKAMSPNGTAPMMATLREQVALANNNTTYKFGFNEQKSGVHRTDILLSIKDSFGVNGISLGILVERKTKPGSGVIHYYPDPLEINAVGAAFLDIEAVYNGLLKVQIDRDVMLDKMSTRRFRVVPQRPTSQEPAYGGVGGTNLLTYNTTQAQQNAADGIMMIEPNLILRGTKQNEFTVTLPAFDLPPTMQANDAAFEISLVMELHGFLVQGGAGLVQGN